MLSIKNINTTDFKVISENCINLGKEYFLTKSDMGNNTVNLFAHKNGLEIAGLVNAFKCSDSSIEKILEMIKEPYYIQRIADVFN